MPRKRASSIRCQGGKRGRASRSALADFYLIEVNYLNEGDPPAKVGRSIIKSLREIRAWQRGSGAARLVEAPDPIPPVRIKAIRKKVAKSIRVFSERFGLPNKTVQHPAWSPRQPSGVSGRHERGREDEEEQV